MTDIHTHILPAVDDGSPGTAYSVGMLKESVEKGVNRVVLTPHYRANFNKSSEELNEVFAKFKEDVKKENIPIELFLGQEIHITNDIKRLFKDNVLLTINGTRYVLIEYDFIHKCDYAETVHELKCEGLLPIVAHPERYEFMTLDDVYDIKSAGGYVQVNADSIVGVGRWRYRKFIKNMFREGLVDFVSSDMHYGRTNCMEEAYKYIARKFGADAAEVVFNLNANHILKG